MNRFAIGFRWAVVIGILEVWFFALPGNFIPNAVLGVVGADPVLVPVWPAFACWILTLLSIFYIPAAVDPFRYIPLAVCTVAARLGGVVFFFVLVPGRFPPALGYVDLGLAVLQGALLLLALRFGPVAESCCKECRA